MQPNETPIAKHRAVTLALIVALIVALAGFVFWEHRDSPYLSNFLGTHTGEPATQPQPIATATYTCDQHKTISASYYDSGGSNAPQIPGGPPTPTGSVSLILSDGRAMTLPQTISGSGIRYANADESFIFWSKGNTAFVEEGAGQTQTYQNCVSSDALPAAASSSTPPEEGVMPSDSSMPDSGTVR